VTRCEFAACLGVWQRESHKNNESTKAVIFQSRGEDSNLNQGCPQDGICEEHPANKTESTM
jgi:hypothetical protein